MGLEDRIANIEGVQALREFEKLVPLILTVGMIGAITNLLMDFEPEKESPKEAFLYNNPKEWLYIKKA